MKEEKDENTPINGVKLISLNQKRILKSENEQLEREISELNECCFGLKETILYEELKIEDLNKEIKFRQEQQEQISKQFQSIKENQHGQESKKFIFQKKTKIIKDLLEEEIIKRIPEFSNSNKNNAAEDKNEFSNLTFDHIIVHYTEKFESLLENDDSKIFNKPQNLKYSKQCFKISSYTTFIELKNVACQFFCVENEGEYLITDEAESILIDDSQKINEYLTNYSVFNNNFKLTFLPYIKRRTALLEAQEQKIRSDNKLNDAAAGGGGKDSSGQGYDTTIGKIKSFFNEYIGLKQYLLYEGVDKKEVSSGKKIQNNIFTQSLVNRIDTSFIMLLFLILFYICTIVFIYSSRDIGRNNLKIAFLTEYYQNKDVSDYKSFYRYIIQKLLVPYSNITVPQDKAQNIGDYINPFNLLGYTEYVKKNSTSGSFYVDLDSFRAKIAENRTNQANFLFSSSIHMILAKVQTKNCSTSEFVKQLIVNDNCYNNFFDSSSFYTDKFILNQFSSRDPYFDGKFFLDLNVFRTSQNASIILDVKTNAGTFDGSGYHTDITKNISLLDLILFFNKYLPVGPTFNVAKNSTNVQGVDDLNSYILTDFRTRNIMFLFTLYFPSEDNFSFDFLSTGIISPSRMDFKVFNANIYNNSIMMIVDGVRIIILIFLIIIMIFDIKQNSETIGNYFDSIINIKNVLSIIIFLLFIISFFFRIFTFTQDEKTFLLMSGDKYIDTFNIASQYNQLFLIECFLFASISLKLLLFLKLNDYIRLFYSSIERGLISYMKYSLFFLAIMTGYMIVSHIIWGPYLEEFSTLAYSFIHILLFSMGKFFLKFFIFRFHKS